MSQHELCVIFNPAAGRNEAGRRLRRLLRGWGSHCNLIATTRPGHAEELALKAVHDGFQVVAAAGGDGTVHEVANGILRAAPPAVTFGVIPIGSANDYDYSLTLLEDGTSEAGSHIHHVDVGMVEEPGGRSRYFVNTLSLGLNGAVTLEARRIRRLQGLPLYALATVRALWYHYACPVMTLTIDGQERRVPTLMLSVCLGRREGGFVMAPHVKLDDGMFEFVHASDMSRLGVLRFLPRLALYGPPANHPKVWMGRCKEIKLLSEAPITAHADGEFFSLPEDYIREMTIQVLPKKLTVQRFHGLGPRSQ
jgi:diacylglycerol kinase family enzyme